MAKLTVEPEGDKRHPARGGPSCADCIRALVLCRSDKRHGRNAVLDDVEAIPDGLMLAPILPARQHDDGTARGVGFALLGRAGCKIVPRIDLRGGQSAACPASCSRGPWMAIFDAVNFGGMVAHRLDRRDGFVKRLAKALRFLDLHRVNFGRVHDAGKLSQLARCVIFLPGKLLRDFVEAVYDPPSDARCDGSKAGVGEEAENLAGNVRGNDPCGVGVGQIFAGRFVVDGKLAGGNFAAESARECVGAGEVGIMFSKIGEAIEAGHVENSCSPLRKMDKHRSGH